MDRNIEILLAHKSQNTYHIHSQKCRNRNIFNKLATWFLHARNDTGLNIFLKLAFREGSYWAPNHKSFS